MEAGHEGVNRSGAVHRGRLCEEIAPAVFFGQDDRLYSVRDSAANFGIEKPFDGNTNPAGLAGMARIPDEGLDRVVEAAEECPGECIFIEVD